MKKVIIDTNLWISFLLGHQVQFRTPSLGGVEL